MVRLALVVGWGGAFLLALNAAFEWTEVDFEETIYWLFVVVFVGLLNMYEELR